MHRLVLAAVVVLSCTGCVRSPAARAENWWSARTAHVHLQSDTGRARTTEAAAQLEALEQALDAAFYHCGAPSDRVVEATLLANDDEYEALAGSSAGHFTRARDGAAPQSDRMIVRDSALRGPGGVQTFAHELTHAMVDACFPQAPTWLHEGLASVFETVRVVDGNVLTGTPPYRISSSAYFDLIWLDGVAVLEVPRPQMAVPSALVILSHGDFHSEETDSLHGAGARRAGNYAGAWALVHMLALGQDADLRARFRRYLDTLSGALDGDAMPLGIAFAGIDLDARLDAYLATGAAGRSRRAFASVAAPPAIEPMSAVDAHLALAALVLSSEGPHGYEAARPHLDAAEADPGARVRALILRAAFDPDRQDAWIEAALAHSPDDPDALRAGIFSARGRHDYETADQRAQQLATHADLDVPMLLMVATLERHMGRLDDALAHATTALQRDRTSWQTWFVLGRIAAARADWPFARRAARFVELFARRVAPGMVALASRWIGRIDAAAAGTGPVEAAENPF
jgi:hypothetical protein